jgi:hypothetical protein
MGKEVICQPDEIAGPPDLRPATAPAEPARADVAYPADVAHPASFEAAVGGLGAAAVASGVTGISTWPSSWATPIETALAVARLIS